MGAMWPVCFLSLQSKADTLVKIGVCAAIFALFRALYLHESREGPQREMVRGSPGGAR